MRCRHCKKKITQEESFQKVKLSFVHSSCLDAFIKGILCTVNDKKTAHMDQMKADKKRLTLKKTLWKSYYSPYIRQRDADSDGNCICISCKRSKPWKEMHAGHFIPKSAGEFFYFNDDNVHAQCAHCNTFGSQDTGSKYDANLRKKLGDKIVDGLLDAKAKRPTVKRTLADYKEMVKAYKERLLNL